jgi:hypothetical protein
MSAPPGQSARGIGPSPAAEGGQTRRRVRLYAGRLRRMVAGKGISEPCVFLHLPKCGGTSLSEALYAAVPMQQRIGVIDALATRRAAALLQFGRDDVWACHDDLENGAATFALRDKLLLTHMCWDTRLIHGHLLYTDTMRQPPGERYKVVTVMREPTARAISNFRMAVRAGLVPPDPDAWLGSLIGRNHATVNLRYLSGRSTVPEEATAAALETAGRNLDSLALVGFLDALPKLVGDFADLFGPRLVLHRYNEARGDDIALSRSQRQRLEELCAPDIALHERARARFG